MQKLKKNLINHKNEGFFSIRKVVAGRNYYSIPVWIILRPLLYKYQMFFLVYIVPNTYCDFFPSANYEYIFPDRVFLFFLYRASLEITKSKLSFMPRVLSHSVEQRGSENGWEFKGSLPQKALSLPPGRESIAYIGLNGVTSPIVWRKTPR